MQSVSASAIGAALAVSAVVAATPAAAQKRAAQPQVEQVRTFSLTKEERAALLPLQTAINSYNYAAAAAALPAAKAAASGADARYFVAQYQLRLGIGTGNSAMQAQAIDALIESNVTPAADLPQLYANKAALLAGAGEYKKAEAIYSRLNELAPNNPDTLTQLAELKNDLGKIPESVALLERAIALRQASGQAVPEGWYKRIVKIAADARIAPQALRFSRDLAAAYPSEENWRDAVLIHRDLAGLDPAAMLDLLRLKRSAKALHGERDYLELAEALSGGGLPLEAKAVLDEGIARRMVDPAKPVAKALAAQLAKRAAADKKALAGLEAKASTAATGAAALAAADAFFAAGDYAKAADLYRVAVQKGSVDSNVANSRLGMALALAGRKAEAQAAFQTVTGNRSNLASLWLTWLSRGA